jgi:hypothetical protein
MKKYFNIEDLGEKDYPCTLVDKFDRILIWHLPDIISSNRLVCYLWTSHHFSLLIIFQNDYHGAILNIKNILEIGSDKTTSWRLAGFSDDCDIFGRGVKSFSPGWFMQAQDVSTNSILR